MINLTNRTEYSFKLAYGQINDVLAQNSTIAAGMCDRNSTWGHYQWQEACKKAGIKSILGVELHVCVDADDRTKQPRDYMRFIARNEAGLEEIYSLVTLSTDKFYYEPRIDYSTVNNLSDNVFVITGNMPDLDRLEKTNNVYFSVSPSTHAMYLRKAVELGFSLVATSDNYFPDPDDRPAYEIVVGNNADYKTSQQHILDVDQWKQIARSLCLSEPHIKTALANCEVVVRESNVELQKATMVTPEKPKTLRAMCEEGAIKRGIDLTDKVYSARLDRELSLIQEKDFEDYFYVVADLCKYAKSIMFVGPARGSSCGSLVCYLIEITEVDPIPYDLLFERFIDVNRMDYPDIDIDFPDTKRALVFDYLEKKYGSENVARLGTISKYKSKSTIVEVSKALKIKPWEISEFKESVIERIGGSNKFDCIKDTFEGIEAGKKALEDFPELRICTTIEGHNSHTGQHAAGMLVTGEPVSKYCPVDQRQGVAMIDKFDAEDLNLLKIDILGLRTLSVIEDCLEQIGWSYDDLNNYKLDDPAAFEILNKQDFAGVFQFEGASLKSICSQLVVENLEDIVSLTALARPGPMASGGTGQFVKRRSGKAEVEYSHIAIKPITEVTYGVIVYQEQVMQVIRQVGGLSWPEVSKIRKAISKSQGKEIFDQYFEKFKTGAAEHGVDEEKALEIWENLNTMGAYAFNRSHAVAYGIVSYWCCVLKAHFPLEFASASLRNAKDDEQSINILRELAHEGYEYKKYDRNLSQENWSVHDGILIGGLIGIKGIGPKSAPVLAKKIAEGKKLTPNQEELLTNGVTPWDDIFETKTRWGHIFENPRLYNINSKLSTLDQIPQEFEGDVLVIAKIVSKELHDLNEQRFLDERGGERMTGQTHYINFVLSDDTGQMAASITNKKFNLLSKPIIDEAAAGDWYLIKGWCMAGRDKIYIGRYKRLSDNELYENPNEVSQDDN